MNNEDKNVVNNVDSTVFEPLIGYTLTKVEYATAVTEDDIVILTFTKYASDGTVAQEVLIQDDGTIYASDLIIKQFPCC